MPGPESFIDTNILIYLLSEDKTKADVAEKIIKEGGLINVQVLNEITNVTRRKLQMPWDEINELLMLIQSICPVRPLTLQTHEKGRFIAERYNLSVYDAMIVAAALLEGCKILYSEDMHHDLPVENQLYIHNPFLVL